MQRTICTFLEDTEPQQRNQVPCKEPGDNFVAVGSRFLTVLLPLYKTQMTNGWQIRVTILLRVYPRWDRRVKPLLPLHKTVKYHVPCLDHRPFTILAVAMSEIALWRHSA